MKFTLALILICIFASACSATPSAPTLTPAPTMDVGAVQTQAAIAIFATQTASVPTATPTPKFTNTTVPTDTPVPTNTPLPSATPTNTNTPAPTNTPEPSDTPTTTPTPKPTNTARPHPTATPVATIAAIPKNSPIVLGGKWEVTYVGEFRDKTLFFYDNGLTAFGTYVTIQFRIKNLQTGTDAIDNTYSFVAIDPAANVYEQKFSASQNAAWEYCGCSVDVNNVDPGQEAVIMETFDVPEATQRLAIFPRDGFFGKIDLDHHWIVENVDLIAPFKHK